MIAYSMVRVAALLLPKTKGARSQASDLARKNHAKAEATSSLRALNQALRAWLRA